MQSQKKRTFQNLSIVGNYPGIEYKEEQFQGSCFINVIVKLRWLNAKDHSFTYNRLSYVSSNSSIPLC